MNTYNITLSEGRLIAIPSDGVNEELTSIPLVGYDTSGYGEAVATAQLRMLENFASDEPPKNPLEGQRWFRREDQKLVLWDGEEWVSAGRSPVVPLRSLSDVVSSQTWGRTGPPERGALRFSAQGQWLLASVNSSFVNLTDTPASHTPRRYLRVNQSSTALVHRQLQASEDFSGVASMDQIPLPELCDWLRANGCLPTPTPPQTTQVTIGTSGLITSSPTGAQDLLTGSSQSVTIQSTGGTRQAPAVSTTCGASGVLAPLTSGTQWTYTFTVPQSACALTFVDQGPPASNPIQATSHITNGSCQSPTGSTCSVTGRATVTLPSGYTTPGGGAVVYRWTVDDGNGPIFEPSPGATTTTVLETSSPAVNTRLTRATPTTVNRRFTVRIREAGSGIDLGTALVPTASYQFLAQTTSATASIQIDGVSAATRNGFTFAIVGEGTGVTSVTRPVGSTVTVSITRNDPVRDLDEIVGCGGTTDTLPPNQWTYTFTVPLNGCTANIRTRAAVIDENILTTSMPPGFSISPSYPGGAVVPTGENIVFTVTQTGSYDRRLTGITGCDVNALTSPTPGPGVHGPWTYTMNMPPNDCTVSLTTAAAIQVQASVTGSCDNIQSTPITNQCVGVGVVGGASIILTPTSSVTATGGSGQYTFSLVPGSISHNLTIPTQANVTVTQVGTTNSIDVSVAISSGLSTAQVSGTVSSQVRVTDANNPANSSTVVVECSVFRRWECGLDPQ